MQEDNSARLLVLLGKGIRYGLLLKQEVMSLVDKINHYSNLLQGKFEWCQIIHIAESYAKEDKVVLVR